MIMEYFTIQVGSYGVNTTFLVEGDSCYLVDPGQEGKRILEILKEKGLVLKGVLLTHAHFDHIGAINDLEAAFPGLPVYVHQNDVMILNHPLNSAPGDYPKIKKPGNIVELNSESVIPGLKGLKIIFTPGHTPGGVCYYFEDLKLLLSGDTLFQMSIGRTDFPGGDMLAMMSSLRKLIALPDDTKVIPGHGSFTTIGFEKEANPYLMGN